MGFRLICPTIKLILLLLIVAVSACRKRSGNNCSGGDGLVANAWDGSSLAPLKVSFTFDDATGDAAEEIARFLQAAQASSVFFTTGISAQDKQSILNTISGSGHLIGSLGWSGQDLSRAPDPVMEIRRADLLMQSYASGNVFLVRSSGDWNSSVVDALKSGGLSKYAGGIGMDVGWKINGFSDDVVCKQASLTPEVCAAGYATEIHKTQRGIVNFRSTSSYTLTLVRALVSQLQTEGYSFVRVDSIPSIRAKLVGGASQAGKSGGATCDDYQ